jgi:hypothetical protein
MMPETVTTKSFFKSRTFWINLAMIVAYVLTALLDNNLVKQYPQAVLVIGMLVNVINMALRAVTTRPVSMGGGDVRTLRSRQ